MLARAAAICGDRGAAAGCGAARSTPSRTGSSPHTPRRSGSAGGVGARPGRRARPDGSAAHDHHLSGAANGGSPAATRWPTSTRGRSTRRAPRATSSRSSFPWCEPHTEPIMGLFRDYVARKRARGLLDFDDLLLAWRACSATPPLGPAIADALGSRARRRVPGRQPDPGRHRPLLRPTGEGLTVVGDDAQAVYGFRGADSGHLPSAPGRLPRRRVVRLERNFRSRPALLDLANVVRPSTDGLRLRLHSDRGRQSSGHAWSAATTRRPRPGWSPTPSSRRPRTGERLRDHAVLMRTGHHSDLLEVELTARRVPVRQVRRAEVPRGRARQGLPRGAAAARQPLRTRSPGSGCCACTTASARRAPGRCSTRPGSHADSDAETNATPTWPLPHRAHTRARLDRDCWAPSRGARTRQAAADRAGGVRRHACGRCWRAATPTTPPGSADLERLVGAAAAAPTSPTSSPS